MPRSLKEGSRREGISKPSIVATEVLRVAGARTHNLQNVSIDIAHNQLTVITGVSGSGKSSLAFDTIYAEGQRQYIESLSTYARQFLDQLQRPDVDSIEGLQPTLCIDQRVGVASPRSTVATVTEVYDYMRLLMARVGTPHCYECGQPILQQSPDQILSILNGLPEGTKLVLMAPVVRGRRGGHRDVLQAIQKAGLLRVRVDNELYDIESVPELALRKNHDIEAVVDKIVIRPDNCDRLSQSMSVALRLANGLVSVSYLLPSASVSAEGNQWIEQLFSTRYACATCGVNFEELEPRTFSFNSPYGACPTCDGVGRVQAIDDATLVSDWSLAPSKGAIAILNEAPKSISAKLRKSVKQLIDSLGLQWTAALDSADASTRKKLIEGSTGHPGLRAILEEHSQHTEESEAAWLEQFRSAQTCTACNGSRLRREALSVRLDGKNISDICQQNLSQVLPWFEGLSL